MLHYKLFDIGIKTEKDIEKVGQASPIDTMGIIEQTRIAKNKIGTCTEAYLFLVSTNFQERENKIFLTHRRPQFIKPTRVVNNKSRIAHFGNGKSFRQRGTTTILNHS